MANTTTKLSESVPSEIQGQTEPRRKIHCRRAHKKSHLGCLNCKKRRIKCNEQLPVCLQCQKSKATCSYLSLQPHQLTELRLRQSKMLGQPVDQGPMAVSSPQYPTTLPSLQAALSNFPLVPSAPTHPSAHSQNIHNTPPYAWTRHLPPPSQVPSSDYTTRSPSAIASGPSGLTDISNTMSTNIPAVPPKTAYTQSTGSSASEMSIVRQGFETNIMRDVYFQWLSRVYLLACENSYLYHAVMSLSYCILSLKSTNRVLNTSYYAKESGKHRYIAAHELNRCLSESNMEYPPEALLATSLILSWDIFFQEEDFSAYATLSKGFVAVLEETLSRTTQQANHTVVCMADSLFQGIKAVQIPFYNRDVLEELLGKIDSLKDYLTAGSANVLDPTFVEYSALVSFLRDVSCYLLTSKRVIRADNVSYFSPMYLFSLLRTWLRMFPCKALALGSHHSFSQLSEHQIVLYTYYHAVTRLLDALFPETRYLFQFGFIGPIEQVSVEDALENAHSLTAEPLLRYPKKVISFFKERLFHYNRLIGNRHPFASQAGPWPFSERQVHSFENTCIGPEHFPRLIKEETPEHDGFTPSAMYNQNVPPCSRPGSMASSNSISDSTVPSPSTATTTPTENPKIEATSLMDSELNSNEKPAGLGLGDAGIFQIYFQDRMKIFSEVQ